MACIVFSVYPASSHLQATFSIAKGLEARGYQILYCCLPDAEPLVAQQGFAFEPIADDIYPKGYRALRRNQLSLRGRGWRWLAKWNGVRKFYYHQCESRAYRQELKHFKGRRLLQSTLTRYQPIFALVDAFLPHYAAYYAYYKIPCLYINTMLCLDYSPKTPPLNTNYIVQAPYDCIYLPMLWCLHWIKNRASMWLLWPFLWHYVRFMRHILKEATLTTPMLTRRCMRPILSDHKEIVLMSKAFDFPRRYPPTILFGMQKVSHHPDVTSGQSQIDNRIAQIDLRHRQLIYCALGNYSHLCQQAHTIFHAVIQAFSHHSCYVLILSIGTRIDASRYSNLAEHIHLFSYAPQRSILTRASLMITHAGLNSVKECIATATPMLAIPFANDGFGNAARIVYHGLGRRLNRRTVSANKIFEASSMILQQPAYAMRMRNMRRAVQKAPDAIEIIMKEIQQNNANR